MAQNSYYRPGDNAAAVKKEKAQPNNREARAERPEINKTGTADFVPPSIDMVSGKSVMGEESPGFPLVPSTYQPPETMENPYYAAGYLKSYLGKKVRAQFLIGTTGTLVDRAGILLDVGANFIVLQQESLSELLLCDTDSLRFITIYR